MLRILSLIVFSVFLAACAGGTNSASPTQPLLQTASPLNLTIEPTQAASSLPAQPVSTALIQPLVQTLTPESQANINMDPGSSLINVAEFPEPDRLNWRMVAEGLEMPVGLTHAGDGSGRIFVIEQTGKIRVLRESVLSPEPFLDLTERINSQGFEQGLLGLAFHPFYEENGYFFVNYTDLLGDTVVSRFQVDPQNPEQANPNSEEIIIQARQPFANHNGGMLAFGPDGYLYIGLGDGGSAGDPEENGQALDSLLGKILRLDVDSNFPYAIPPGNAFTEGKALPEIWAYGLRNPWRFSFDSLTGDLYIADVGQNLWEEINFLPAGAQAGANFGWNLFEASQPFAGQNTDTLELVFPIFEYNHEQGCSVTGGVVYRGEEIPAMKGVYLFGDFCSGSVWGLLPGADGSWRHKLLFEKQGTVTSFGEDEQGNVFLVIHAGQIFRLGLK